MAEKCEKGGNESLNYIFDDNELLICLVCKTNIKADLSFDHDVLLSNHLNSKKHQKNVRALFKLCVPNWGGSHAQIIQSLVFDVSLERNVSSFVSKTDNIFVCLVCQETISQGTDCIEIVTSIIRHIKTDFHLINLKDGVSWIHRVDHKVAFIMFHKSEVHCSICRQNLENVITCPMVRAMDHLKVHHNEFYKILYHQQNKDSFTYEKNVSQWVECLTLTDETLPSAKCNSTILKRASLTLDQMEENLVNAVNKSLNHIFYDNGLLICLVCKNKIDENLSIDHDVLLSNHLNSKKHEKNVRALFKLCVPNWSGSHAQIIQSLVFDVTLKRNESSFVSKTGNTFVCMVCQETIAQGTDCNEIIVTSIIRHIETDFHLIHFKNSVSWIHPVDHVAAFIMFYKSEVHCSICRRTLKNVITCPMTRAMDHLKVYHSVVYKILYQQRNKDSFTNEKSVCQALDCLTLTDETLPSVKSSSSDRDTELLPSAKSSSSDRLTKLLLCTKSSSSDKDTELTPIVKSNSSERYTKRGPSTKSSSSERDTKLGPSAKSSSSDRDIKLGANTKSSSSDRNTMLGESAKSSSSDRNPKLGANAKSSSLDRDTKLGPIAMNSSSDRDTELLPSVKSSSADGGAELSLDTFEFDADEFEELVGSDDSGESSNESINICVDDLICPECGDFIEIFNENADFSMDLHLQKHKPLMSANTESDFHYQDDADYVCPICQETIQIFNGDLKLSIDCHFEEEKHEHERFTLADCGDKNRFDFLSRVFDKLPHDVRDQKSVFVMDGNEVFCKLCSCTVSSSKHVPDACKVFSDHLLSTFHVDQFKASSQFLAMAVLNYNKQSFPQEGAKDQDNVFKHLCKQQSIIECNKQFIEKRQINYYCTACDKHICYSPKENTQALNFVFHFNGKLHKQYLKRLEERIYKFRNPVDDYSSNTQNKVVSEKEAEINKSISELSKRYRAVLLNQAFINEKNGDFFCEICQVMIEISKTGSGLRIHCASHLHNTELSARSLLYLSQLNYEKLPEKYIGLSALSNLTKHSYLKPHTHFINHNGEDFCCIICNMPIPGSRSTGKNIQRHFFSFEHRRKCFEVTCNPDSSPAQLKSKNSTLPSPSANAKQKSVNTTTEIDNTRARKKLIGFSFFSPIIRRNYRHIEIRNGGFFCIKCKEHISCNSSGSHLIEHFNRKQH